MPPPQGTNPRDAAVSALARIVGQTMAAHEASVQGVRAQTQSLAADETARRLGEALAPVLSSIHDVIASRTRRG